MNKFSYITLLCSLVISSTVFSQENVLDARYNIDFENTSLYEAFVKISQETGYHFSYDANYIDSDELITQNFQEQSLESIIQDIVGELNIDLKIVGNQIIIARALEEQNSKDDAASEIEIYPFLHFSGDVIDLKTNKPIPFATVSVVGESVGTITNENGRFVLKIPREFDTNVISIASLGYKSLNIPVVELDTVPGKYHLKQDYIPIQEVIIRKQEPHNILKTAVAKISENYCREPALYTTFYRETIKKNRDYVAHSEAILFIHKSSYNNEFAKDQVKVFKSRKTLNVSAFDTVMLKLKGGIETSLFLDIAKNPVNLITEENFKFYNYILTDIILYDDKPTYVIEFDQKVNVDFPLFKGKIYIDINTFGIRGAEFSLSPMGLNRASEHMVVKRSRRVRVKPLGADYMVKYREIKGKYFLNHIRFETHFRVKRKKQLFSDDFTTITEMAVNNIDTAKVRRFKYKELANVGDIFQDQHYNFDPSFWGHLNYLMPDKPLEDAIIQIDKILYKRQ